MKVKDFSPIPYQGGQLAITDRIHGVLKLGASWISDMKSQEIIIRYLATGLGDAYTLFRNMPLPDFDTPIPLILAGPHGVTLIYHNAAKGIFRARGNVWSEMDGRKGKFRTAKPNLILRVTLMARAIETFLNDLGYRDLTVDGILVLTNPGTHVESVRSDVRIILVDALSRLSSHLANAAPVLDHRKIRDLLDAMTRHLEPVKTVVIAQPKRVNPAIQAVDDNFNQALSPLKKTFKFSTRQWMLLAGIVVANVIILLVFLMIILASS